MRKTETWYCCILIACLLLTAGSASAASMWLNGRDLYSTQGGREFKPGDIVTIQIEEEATAQQGATTNLQKDASVEMKADPVIPFFKKISDKFVGKNEVKNKMQGQGTTSRTGKLNGTVTAQVLEVLPNGNILLEGTRATRVNKETQILRVRGVARPQDVDYKNTVSSKVLANAEIKFEGKGAVGATQRPGIMTKIAHFIF